MGYLKLKRGTEAQRTGFTPEEGELILATDSRKLYIGDGTTAGGNPISASASGNITVDTLTANVVNANNSARVGNNTVNVSIASGNVTATGRVTAEGRVSTASDFYTYSGDLTDDNYARLQQITSSNAYGFVNSFGDATVLSNEHGATNQALYLGDVDSTSGNVLFGISVLDSAGNTLPTTGSEAWQQRFYVTGRGDIWCAGNISGNASGLTSINGANVIGTVASANNATFLNNVAASGYPTLSAATNSFTGNVSVGQNLTVSGTFDCGNF